ncbi:carboxymuconolactone decarboxylase family protein [Chitinophaga eiseniae]|uniref:Carboxymuconolactone decarboxylase family protein n=1 Tax=Chitinophaga eiseniae TaxID=634771 RepID=A0A847SL38_9BACT|nr:carboxymuconolactone decarboxylase family protein [Chitinophaga eiseniae]NLR78288.1 carboxymuconolactone decarboxylase family protein [Chitinophaga eiseniae]
MSTITALPLSEANHEATRVLEQVNRQLGRIPNMYSVMAHSPAVLEAYTQFSNSLRKGSLGAPMAERIAIASAEYNGCTYCLSAHSFTGAKAGLSEADIREARALTATDPKVAAGMAFTQKLLANPGDLSTTDVTPLRNAGYTDGEILEIIANVVRNIFTNYLNVVAGTEVDWPLVTPANANSYENR